eukprot:CAMPEP_0178582574 /NCGR_PEP_ID=MMETSP0697-20121206/23799_1 /TAXON_ID=265572 /ORGANISM="Extubocellulus spinifer, Strain CCMP396" /LENGTH=737 /DNA_ID=CAMNT_0020218319 /DNA_START=180 /DNA_END=2393 /DNA_ORIENTATION=+
MSAPPPPPLLAPPLPLTGPGDSTDSRRSVGITTTAATSAGSSSSTGTMGRISPHLHLDLSCVSVPPLPSSSLSWNDEYDADNSSSSNNNDLILRRCRSDSEATLGSADGCGDEYVRSGGTCGAGAGDSSRCDGTGGSSSTSSSSRARPDIEPPPWAIEAKGEARLEPVCESLGIQQPIDLTQRPCYRVGRSPQSDIQLLHATSSRKHALLFHHPNGSCYVVDCGSAHGTYVNGVKVKSGSAGSGSAAGGGAGSGTAATGRGGRGGGGRGGAMVIPHRVRRGALIRFGGPGAPCFVLKSFAVGFDALVKDLGGTCASCSANGTDTAAGCESSSTEDSADATDGNKRHHEVSEYSCGTLLSGVNQDLASEVTKRLLGFALPGVGKSAPRGASTGTGTSTSTTDLKQESEQKPHQQQDDTTCATATASSTPATDAANSNNNYNNERVESTAALLQINTRLNALGGTESLSPHGRKLARDATVRLLDRLRAQAKERSMQLLLGLGPAGTRTMGRTILDGVSRSDSDVGMLGGGGAVVPLTEVLLPLPDGIGDVAADADASPSGTGTGANPVMVSPVTLKQSCFFATSSPMPSGSGSKTSVNGTTAPPPPSIPTSLSLLDTPSRIVRPILSASLPPPHLSMNDTAAVRKVSSDSLCIGGSSGADGASTPPLRKNRSGRDPNRRVKFSQHTECVYAPSVTPDEVSLKDSFDSEDGDGHDHQRMSVHHRHAPKTPRGTSTSTLQ